MATKRSTSAGGGRGQRHRWTPEQGRAAIDGLARSGLSASSFARRERISRARLVYWKKCLGDGSPAPTFVAVALPVTKHQIEIAHGEIVLRVREDLDVEHLARIVYALRARGC